MMSSVEAVLSDPPEHAPDPAPRDYRIAAVDRALDLIETLSRIGPASLARIATEARCSRTAAFRLLRTLQAREFAVQEERGAWRLSLRWAMTSTPGLHLDTLAATAGPHLARLAARVGENTFLRVRRDLTSRTIARRRASPELPLSHEPEEGGPLHAGSGRLLLAYAPDRVQAEVLSRKLPRFTASTRVEAAWVRDDLPRIRERGWLIANEDVTHGSIVLAAPVRDARGEVVAALVIAAATLRLRGTRPRALVPSLVDAADRLSRVLGDPTVASPVASASAPKSVS